MISSLGGETLALTEKSPCHEGDLSRLIFVYRAVVFSFSILYSSHWLCGLGVAQIHNLRCQGLITACSFAADCFAWILGMV